MRTGEATTLFDYLYWTRDVMHLVSHGIQQFSEAAVLLTRAAHSPGDIGFLEFVGRRARPG